jgi:hypothetical protein
MTVKTCHEYTKYDTKLSVYSSSCGNLQCVNADDDGCSIESKKSDVSWNAERDSIYYILVHGWVTDPVGDYAIWVQSREPTVSFFVTGGRFTGDSLAILPEQLTTLPNLDGNSILFHLGDWNSPFATSCVESSHEINDELYQNSALPVYFVPGDNEFNGE